MAKQKPWRYMRPEEKIGTVIGYIISIGILAVCAFALISRDISFSDIFLWIATFFTEAWFAVIVAGIVLLVLVCVFPGVLIILAVAVVFIILSPVIAWVVSLF